MDIIHKYIPKNPINSATQEKMKNRIKEVLEKFCKNYASQTQLVIVKNKEYEIKKKEIRKSIVDADREKKKKYYKKTYGPEAEIPDIPEIPEKGAPIEVVKPYCMKLLELGFKPVRPRAKLEPLKSPELRVNISRYEYRDYDVDPFAVYMIKASQGKLSAEKDRRYKEFEKLHKALKKIIPKDITLPEASSKIGIRNLNEAFLSERVQLLNEYLQKIVVIPEVQTNEDFLNFIGLLPSKNPLDDQIFDNALRRTKYDLWNWYRIRYDKSEEAISNLLIREVYRSIEIDINLALPTAEAPRKASRKLAYKMITTAVEAAVPPAWSAAYKASGPVRETVQKALGELIGIILEKKKEINDQLKEKMADSFIPIKDSISKLLGLAVPQIVPPIIKPFSFLIKTYKLKSEPIVLESFKDGDKNKLKEATDVLNQIHKDLMQKLGEEIDKEMKITCEKLQGAVTLRLLNDMFNPINKIGTIVGDFVKMVNPEHWGKITEILFEYKNKLKNCEGSNVDEILNDMERRVEYNISWESYYIDNGRYWLRWDIYRLGFETISDIAFDLGKKLNKLLFKAVMKKFTYKFADYVWGYSVKKTDDTPWSEKVDEAFLKAYNSAKKKFTKGAGNIIKMCVCDFMQGMVINEVAKSINEVLKPILNQINGAIPNNIKEMIDVKQMANDDINELLEQTFETAVDEQGETFSKEVDKAVDEYQL